MVTVIIELPDDVYSALRKSPSEFAQELRIASACHWYDQGQLSQGKAAEVAGLSRSEFLDELFHRRIPAGPDSDIDLLVEFFPDARPTLPDMAQIEIELSQAMGGRKVDLRTPQDLSRYFRDEVVRTAEAQYVAG